MCRTDFHSVADVLVVDLIFSLQHFEGRFFNYENHFINASLRFKNKKPN